MDGFITGEQHSSKDEQPGNWIWSRDELNVTWTQKRRDALFARKFQLVQSTRRSRVKFHDAGISRILQPSRRSKESETWEQD
jgi:hypothetical protein